MSETYLEIQWKWMYACGVPVAAAVAIGILFFPANIRRWLPVAVTWALILYGASEVVLGLCQVYGMAASRHAHYALTGTFYNPGPYSGFLALVFPLCLNEYLRQRGGKRTIPYYIALFTLTGILCVLPAGMSRSAWLAAVTASGYLGFVYGGTRLRKCVRRYGLPLLLAGSIGVAGIYLLKKDSADGRLLMWKVAARAVCQQPLSGYGWNNVAGAYGQAQEEYFSTGRYTAKEEHVAGSPEYVFNEYLQIALAEGIPVLLAGLLLMGTALYAGHRRQAYGLCGALVSLSVFAFSSYPLQFPAFVSALALLLSGCLACGLPPGNRSIRLAAFLLLLAGSCVCYLRYGTACRRVEACRTWATCRGAYRSGAYSHAADCYAILVDNMEWNARFLFEYGHALHKCHRAEESTAILKKALRISSDPMILNIIGKNEHELKHYQHAEYWLWRAVHRLPGRIYPYFLLANLYADPAYSHRDRLEQMVHTILEKEPKVQSTAIQQMRQQAKELLKRAGTDN